MCNVYVVHKIVKGICLSKTVVVCGGFTVYWWATGDAIKVH